eukprot:8873552-Pyramimonas_sp.AAC.1
MSAQSLTFHAATPRDPPEEAPATTATEAAAAASPDDANRDIVSEREQPREREDLTGVDLTDSLRVYMHDLGGRLRDPDDPRGVRGEDPRGVRGVQSCVPLPPPPPLPVS